MAEKSIKTQETDGTDEIPDGPTQYDQSLKISQLTLLTQPVGSEYAVLATPGGETYKITLSALRADLSAYKVKTINKGTYIENITESPEGSGNWTINAEKQGPGNSGVYVEKLNDATGVLTIASSDDSITVGEPTEANNKTIDLTLNTTTSTMFRAWIEVDATTQVSGVFDFENDKITKDNSIVTINGVVLEGTQYDLTAGIVTILNLQTVPLVVDDEIGVVSYTAEVPNSTFGNPTYGLRTNDISIVGDDPAGNPEPKAIAANNLQTQQDVNWYLLRAIESLDIPEAIEIPEGLATTEYVDEQDAETLKTAQSNDLHILSSANGYCDDEIKKLDIPSIEGLATQEYVDAADSVVQEWVTDKGYLVDEGQNTQIETLENKVTALEGSVVEAQYKADTRDEPQIGAFVLKNMLDEKVIQFSQAVYIILSQTDFTNKTFDASKILNGDTVRLVMSPSNYANYTVTGVANRNGNIALEVTFMSSGSEGLVLDGFVYDFNHATPFDVGAACTKQYSDDQDAVTLNAAKAYADSLEMPEMATNVMVTDGEQDVSSGWKIISGGKTFVSVGSSQVGLYHVKAPTDEAHPVTLGYLEDGSKTIHISGSTAADAKIYFGSDDYPSPQNEQKNLLSGCYKSNGGARSYWSYGFNQVGGYWNYDWSMGSNLKMRWIMGDQNKEVMTIDKTGVDMPAAYIVGDYSLDGVAEDQVEAVKANAREIDIGHRLRELKKILVNLKTALKTKSADAQQALLDVLEHVEDI